MNVWTALEARSLVNALRWRKESVCGIDAETEGSDPRKDPPAGPKGRIVCWSLAWDDQSAFIWATSETWEVLAPMLQTLPVVGHNAWGYDVHFFRKAGVTLGNVVADTMRMHKLINTAEDAHHGLKSLIKWWLGIEPVGGFEELFTRLKKLEDDPGGDLKETRRKVGDTPRVPTLVGGPSSRVGSIREVIPLSTVPADYPHLLPTLIKYAKLDARATLELYRLFQAKMKETPWEVPLIAHRSTQASGTRRAG